MTLSPWIALANPPNVIQPSAPGQDANASPLSGSAEISHLEADASSLAQCVPIDRAGSLDLHAQFRFTPTGASLGVLRTSCQFFDSPNCDGSTVGLESSDSMLEDTASAWLPLKMGFSVSPEARSGLCSFTLLPQSSSPPSFDLGLDALVLSDSLIFRDGFESGDTSAWSQTTP